MAPTKKHTQNNIFDMIADIITTIQKYGWRRNPIPGMDGNWLNCTNCHIPHQNWEFNA